MAKKDDIEQPNPGAPAADIPNLKKKEEERKKGGVAWGGARGANAFRGAIARAAAGASGAMGSGGTGLLATILRFLAGLSLLGKLAAAAAAVMMMIGAGVIASTMMKGGDGALGGPELGALSSSMKVRSGGSDRMGISGKGQIRFDSPAKTAASQKPAEEAKEAGAGGPGEAAPPQAPNGTQAANKLENNMSGAKLSSQIGGSFGGKNIFGSGGSGFAPKFGGGMSKVAATKGQLSASARSGVNASAGRRSVSSARKSRAFGQLVIAKGMSVSGAGNSNAEAAAAAAAGAFDQNNNDSTMLNSNIATPDTNTNAANNTGGDNPYDTNYNIPKPDFDYVDTDLSSYTNQIKQLTDQARKMRQYALLMAIIAAACFTYAACCTCWPLTLIAVIFYALGLIFTYMAYTFEQNSKDMKKQADELGVTLATAEHDKYESDLTQYCTWWSIENNSSIDSCPRDSMDETALEKWVEEQKARDLAENENANNNN